MAQTKFSAGQRVSVTRTGFGTPPGFFRVVRPLPRDAGPQQYRVRSEGDTSERVIDEVRLEAASHD
jgi:hypothetical protein